MCINDVCQVSVLITFNNQKQYIQDCLSSVLNQKTNFQYEVLCGDDCSSDGTYEELLKWAADYPDIICVYQTRDTSISSNEPIVRSSNNRYNLLVHAKGRYICFLDGDDYYNDDNKLQKQFDVLERYPELTACFHPVVLKWNTEHPDVLWCKYSDKAFIVSNKTYWGTLWSHVETFMFRNIDVTLPNDINRDFFDDNLITAHFIKNGKLMYIPEPMCVYRQLECSSWNSRTDFEKSYINLRVYQESKKVLPGMKSQCFTKCYDSIRYMFDHRNKIGDLRIDNKLGLEEPIFLDTIRFKESNAGYRFLYVLKWLFPICFGRVFRSLRRKIGRITWKYI